MQAFGSPVYPSAQTHSQKGVRLLQMVFSPVQLYPATESGVAASKAHSSIS